MAVSDARKSANAVGVKKVKAVFVKVRFGGGASFKYFRQPFNLVEFDWGNGERKTYLELCLGHRFRSYANEATECYDDVLLVDDYSNLAQWPIIGRSDAVPTR